MQLSPGTLSTLAAILSAQGITASGEQLAQLLAPLTDEVFTEENKYNLRQGEVYIVRDLDDRNHSGEEITDRAALLLELSSYASDCYEEQRDLDDRVLVSIQRCTVPITVKPSVFVG